MTYPTGQVLGVSDCPELPNGMGTILRVTTEKGDQSKLASPHWDGTLRELCPERDTFRRAVWTVEGVVG